MKNWLKRITAVLVLLTLILSGPRIIEGLFIPFIQLAALVFPLIIVFAWLSRPWRHGKVFQTMAEKILNFWKHT